MMIRRNLYWLILLLGYGCVRVPDCDLAEMAVSAGTDSVAAEALQRTDLGVGDWPSQRWWEDLGDPVLNNLIEQALKGNPNLLAAEARMKSAAQTALQKRAALYPEIDFLALDIWTHLSEQGFFRAF